jgi:C1A family cysteine protease
MPKYIYNVKPSPPDARDIVYEVSEKAILPTKVDLSSEMPPVLDQKALGSCALNATSNILRHLLKVEKLPEIQPSRLYLYYNTRVLIAGDSAKEDTGCILRDVCKAVQKYHACEEKVWPYIIPKFSKAPPLTAYKNAELHRQVKYVRVPLVLDTIKQLVFNKTPILIGVAVYESFETNEAISSGDIPMPDPKTEKMLGGHAIVLCGYDDDTQRFTIQNSWGTGVGKKGFFTLPYDYVLDPNLAGDFWAFTLFK